MALAYNHITTATTTQVKSGSGICHKIVIGTPVSTGTVTVIDNTSGSSPVVAIITSTADLKPYEIELNARFSTGLRVTTTQSQDITVIYQ
jgi:signal recognition particle receptor subunit beta